MDRIEWEARGYIAPQRLWEIMINPSQCMDREDKQIDVEIRKNK
jgi:hypothetical protein